MQHATQVLTQIDDLVLGTYMLLRIFIEAAFIQIAIIVAYTASVIDCNVFSCLVLHFYYFFLASLL